jgi:nucleoid-associated protein YgaU
VTGPSQLPTRGGRPEVADRAAWPGAVAIGAGDPRRRRRRSSARVRRRRLVAASVVLGTVSLSVPFGLSGGGPLAASGQAAGRTSYTVEAGDTLWAIAERADPGGDPRPVVQALSDELHGDRLRVGQRIALP